MESKFQTSLQISQKESIQSWDWKTNPRLFMLIKIACSNNVPINTGGWLFHLYICSNIKVTSYKHHAQCGCSFIGRKSFFYWTLNGDWWRYKTNFNLLSLCYDIMFLENLSFLISVSCVYQQNQRKKCSILLNKLPSNLFLFIRVVLVASCCFIPYR